MPAVLVIQFCLFPLGLYARFLLEGVTDTDVVIPMLVNDPTVFPRLAGDFLVVAMLGAAMSSLDSVLLVAASVTSRDLLRRTTEATEVRRTRIGVVAFAVLAALVALRPPGGIMDLTIFSGSLYAVCFLPTILLGLHWRRGNENRRARDIHRRHNRAVGLAGARLEVGAARSLSGAYRIDDLLCGSCRPRRRCRRPAGAEIFRGASAGATEDFCKRLPSRRLPRLLTPRIGNQCREGQHGAASPYAETGVLCKD